MSLAVGGLHSFGAAGSSEMGRSFVVSASTGAAIQSALDAVTGSAIYTEAFVPAGTYLVTEALTINSNTRLRLDPAATIKRSAAIDNLIHNDADGVAGVYTANANIEIVGGIWDGNAATYASNSTTMAFGHCTNVTVRGAKFINTYGWHSVELNAVKEGRVEDCIFEDLVKNGSTAAESVQIDLAASAGVFPWFGPYDNTPCIDIRIQGCTFTGTQSRAIGSHTAVTGVRHTKVRIRDNFIENCADEAIQVNNWQDVVISGNQFDDCLLGIYFLAQTTTVCDGFTISGNTFANFTDTTSSRGIYIHSSAVNRTFRNGSITGNACHDIARHGITLDNCDDWTVSGNSVATIGSAGAGTGYGLAAFGCLNVTITGNVAYNAYDGGVVVKDSSSCGVVGNAVRGCQKDGIRLENTDDSQVVGNNVNSCGVLTNDTYYGIVLLGEANRNNVQGNTVRKAAAGNTTRYGMRIGANTCDDNLVTNNDIMTSGATGSYSDLGTGTITTAGNRV